MTKTRIPPIPFDVHEQACPIILRILDDTDKLMELLARKPHQFSTAKLTDALLRLGVAANRIQNNLESNLQRLDNNDLRSWAMYFPDDRPAARKHYSV